MKPQWMNLLLGALAVLWGGCFASTPAERNSPPLAETSQVQVTGERLAVLNGKMDAENRYAAAVSVTGDGGECSGVLVHSRLVLTAAHCVCAGRQEDDTTIIDASTCGKTASVKTVVYGSSHGEKQGPASPEIRDYSGTVWPNGQLKMAFSDRGRLISYHADLAVVFLSEPVKNIPVVSLAPAEVQVGESITMVGYGYDEYPGERHGQRRYGRNEVTAIGNGVFQAKKPGAHFLAGDSGGPCLRETAQGMMLVGIMMSSRIPAPSSSTFTSAHAYLEWLRGWIVRAEKAGSTRVELNAP